MIQEYSDEISFNMLTSMQSYVKDFHLHNFYELFLLLEGEIDFCIQQTFYHLTPGSLLVINDLELHKAINKMEIPYKRIYIHIPPSFFHQYITEDIDLTACFTSRNIGEQNLILLTDKQLGYLVRQFNQLVENSTSTQPGGKLLMETYLIQTLVFVNNIWNVSSPQFLSQHTPTVQNIMNYMENHLAEPISLDSLAGIFALSKYYLCHIFKSETGTTIINYLLLLRISRAKQLLSNGKNVTEACYLSGFNNYSGFITTFKKHTGFTPKKYSALFRTVKE